MQWPGQEGLGGPSPTPWGGREFFFCGWGGGAGGGGRGRGRGSTQRELTTSSSGGSSPSSAANPTRAASSPNSLNSTNSRKTARGSFEFQRASYEHSPSWMTIIARTSRLNGLRSRNSHWTVGEPQ